MDIPRSRNSDLLHGGDQDAIQVLEGRGRSERLGMYIGDPHDGSAYTTSSGSGRQRGQNISIWRATATPYKSSFTPRARSL